MTTCLTPDVFKLVQIGYSAKLFSSLLFVCEGSIDFRFDSMSSSQLSAASRLAGARSVSRSLYRQLVRGVRAQFPPNSSQSSTADARARAAYQLAGKPALLRHATSVFVPPPPSLSSTATRAAAGHGADDETVGSHGVLVGEPSQHDWEGRVRNSFRAHAHESNPEVQALTLNTKSISMFNCG
jgi:hypothetical protein